MVITIILPTWKNELIRAGLDTEVIEYDALEKTWLAANDPDDREHVTLYIRKNPEYSKFTV
jgi:spore coat polysaccharide biosynthesis protein SpsF (cytidylyltransferase family)